MKNTTISLDEQMLDNARMHARKQGYSFNAWVTRLIADAISGSAKVTMSSLIAQASDIAGDSKGSSWTREEIHER